MARKSLRIAVAAAGLVIPTQPILACSYAHAPEPVGVPSGSFIAKKMYAEATFVDLALAERSRPIEGVPPGWAQAITFRVIQRWKGNSPDRFMLFGQRPGQDSGWPGGPRHWVDELGRVYPHATPWEVPLPSPSISTSCDPGFIRPVAGQLYIVFREADGRLLGQVVFHQGRREQPGFPFVPAEFPRGEGWTDAAFLESFDATRPGTAPAAVAAPLPDRALILFKRPITAARAKDILRGSGVRPHAVYTAAGDFLDEMRVPAALARDTIFEEAVTRAAENFSGSHSAARARDWTARVTEADLEMDGWKRLFVTSLIAAEDRHTRARAAGPPIVLAAEVVGPAEALRRLRSSAGVASILPGFTRRGRAAAPVPPGREEIGAPRALDARRGEEKPAALLARLRQVAAARN